MSDLTKFLNSARMPSNSDALRSLLLTAFELYVPPIMIMGGQYMEANAVPTVLTNMNEWYTVAGVYLPSHTTSGIDASVSGEVTHTAAEDYLYHVVSDFSFVCNANNQLIRLKLFKNGVAMAGRTSRKVSTGADIGSSARHSDAIFSTGDKIELRALNATSGATELTVVDGYLFMAGIRS